jgi:hypothetical protein
MLKASMITYYYFLYYIFGIISIGNNYYLTKPFNLIPYDKTVYFDITLSYSYLLKIIGYFNLLVISPWKFYDDCRNS